MNRRPGGERRGSALVELALSFSVLFVLFTGVYQLGYALFVYNELQGAVRSGARYAATLGYDASDASAYATAVRNMVVYGDPNGGSSPVVGNLSTANVAVSVSMSGGRPTCVTVAITGYQIAAVFKNYTINGKPRARFPYVGFYTS